LFFFFFSEKTIGDEDHGSQRGTHISHSTIAATTILTAAIGAKTTAILYEATIRFHIISLT